VSEQIDGRARRYAHRRPEVLEAAAEHALEHGLAGLSLRQVAKSVGVSHATLVHHFATKDQLVAEIVDLVLTRNFSLPDLDPDEPDPLRAIWARATSERGLRQLRLYAEIASVAMRDNPTLRAAVARSNRQRRDLLAVGLVRRGCPPAEADARATLLLGLLRGLVTDLLVSGDKERVDAAFELVAGELAERFPG